MQWKTRDGRLINIVEMETSHIKNTMAFIKRRLREKIERINIVNVQISDETLDAQLMKASKKYAFMHAELERRKEMGHTFPASRLLSDFEDMFRGIT